MPWQLPFSGCQGQKMAIVNFQDCQILRSGSFSHCPCAGEVHGQNWSPQLLGSYLPNRGVTGVKACSQKITCNPPLTSAMQEHVLEQIAAKLRSGTDFNVRHRAVAVDTAIWYQEAPGQVFRKDMNMASESALQEREQEAGSWQEFQQKVASFGDCHSSKRYSVSRGRRIQSVAGYTSMIVMYTRTKRFEEAEKMILEMDIYRMTPDKSNWLARIAAYAQQGKVRETEGTLKRMQESGFSPNLEIFNHLILLYGKARMYGQAYATFSKMSEVGVFPTRNTFRSMIGACGRSGKLKDAVQLLQEMRERRFCPSLDNFSTILNLYGKTRSVAGIVQTVKVMKDMGCKPSAQILDSCVRAMGRAGKLSKNLAKLLSSLKDAGWDADGTSLGPLLNAYLKCEMIQEALKAFRLMRDIDLVPREGLCRELISQCKDAGKVEDAEYVYGEIESAGTSPSRETTCTMMSAFGLTGKVREAENLYMKLRTSGTKLDIVVYNVMIDAYLRAGLYQEATQIFKTVERHHDVFPDKCTFYGMFRVYQKGRLGQEAVELYWKLLGAGIELEEGMINCVINCCGRMLPIDETSKLFKEMLDSGFSPNVVTFNVMIDMYSKAGLLDRAYEVFMICKEHGKVDSVSYSTLINCYGRRRDFINMESMASEMQIVGLGQWAEAYNSMIDAYGKAGQFSQVEEVLRQMHGAGCCPDVLTFNILINVYGKKGLTGEFRRILGRMQDEGQKPDVWTYNTLIGIYGQAEKPGQVMSTFKEMQDAGVEPDRITYTNLVAALEKSGNLWEAARWSLWMTQTGFSTESKSLEVK